MTAKPELSPEKLKEIEEYDRKIFTSDQIVRWCPGCGDFSILAIYYKLILKLKSFELITFVLILVVGMRVKVYRQTKKKKGQRNWF